MMDENLSMGLCYVCSKYTVITEKNGLGFCNDHLPKEKHLATYIPVEEVFVECCVCGQSFKKQRNSNKKYCSKECADYYLRTEYQKGKYLILERDNFTCFYCGKISYKNQVALHVDHVVPRSKGGTSDADNLVTACLQCNLQKANSSIENIDDVLLEIKRRNELRDIPNKLKIKLGSMDKDAL